MSPGMMVRPRTSTTSASPGHESAPRAPAAVTRSPSTMTAASATGAAPVPSMSVAPVNTRIIGPPSTRAPSRSWPLLLACERFYCGRPGSCANRDASEVGVTDVRAEAAWGRYLAAPFALTYHADHDASTDEAGHGGGAAEGESGPATPAR